MFDFRSSTTKNYAYDLWENLLILDSKQNNFPPKKHSKWGVTVAEIEVVREQLLKKDISDLKNISLKVRNYVEEESLFSVFLRLIKDFLPILSTSGIFAAIHFASNEELFSVLYWIIIYTIVGLIYFVLFYCGYREETCQRRRKEIKQILPELIKEVISEKENNSFDKQTLL